jgi:hypothetical protein
VTRAEGFWTLAGVAAIAGPLLLILARATS